MKKSELKQIIKEEIRKTLLNECFSYDSWTDVLKKYPEIFDIFKNDSIVKEEELLMIGLDQVTLEELEDNRLDLLVNALAQGGGACGYNFEDFTPKRVEKFIKDIVRGEQITKDTGVKLASIMNDYFKKHGKEASNIMKNSELERLKSDYEMTLRRYKKDKNGEKYALENLEDDIKDLMDDKNSVVSKFKITVQDVLNYKIT